MPPVGVAPHVKHGQVPDKTYKKCLNGIFLRENGNWGGSGGEVGRMGDKIKADRQGNEKYYCQK